MMWRSLRNRIAGRRSARRGTAVGRSARAAVEAMESRRLLSTSLVSVGTDGAAAGGGAIGLNGAGSTNFSPNGRFVLFTSSASNLVNGVTDSNNAADVFLRDLQTNTTSIVSVNAANTAVGASALASFVFSPDSTRLMFRTQSTNMIAGLADTNNASDWFVRDLLTGTTTCLTVNAAGTSTGNSTSFTNQPPVFSPDSKFVAFVSIAGDLVAGVTDAGGRDVFLRDLDAGTTSLASIALDGTAAGNATEDAPQFSPDGRYIGFLSTASNMVAGVTEANAFTDVFVRDRQTSTTLLVSHTADNHAAGFSSSYQWLPDGSGIVFGSASTSMVNGVADANNGQDFFLWNAQSHNVGIVTVNAAGSAAGDKVSRLLGVSPTGRYVAFGSAATNLTAQSAGGDVKDDLYVRDLQSNTTTYVSRNNSASVVWSLARFSPDGTHLLYDTFANDEIPGLTDANNDRDLFLYNLQTGAKVGVTVNAAGTATANSTGTSDDDVVFSHDGRYVSFVSDAHNLTPGFTTTSTRDLFVRDLVAGVTTLVTAGANGEGEGYDQGGTRDAEFTTDNKFLVYTDSAFIATAVTTPFNFNFGYNLYAFDVVAKTQNLLSINAAGTAPANGIVEPFSFVINPAGGPVLFVSPASDMVAGVSDIASNLPSAYDLFLATEPAAGNPGTPVPHAGLTGNGAAIPAGDATPAVTDGSDFGSTPVGTPVSRTFIVTNSGGAALTTSGLTLPAGFTLVEPLSASIPAGGADSFTVQFQATAVGTAAGNVSFTTNDAAAGTYAFAITATATSSTGNPPPSGGDGPDLVIEGGIQKLKSGSFLGGAKGGAAQVRVVNRGNKPATGNLQVTFYASLDGDLDGGDTAITTVSKKVNLKPNASAVLSAKFNYPGKLPDGHYFILAKADGGNAIAESDEINNLAASAQSITIAAPNVDLQGTALVGTGKFAVGKPASATLTLRNNGNVTASGTATIQLFASTDDTFGNADDILIATTPARLALKPGASKPYKLKASLANVPAGPYKLAASIDITNAIAESDETNNTLFSTSLVQVV